MRVRMGNPAAIQQVDGQTVPVHAAGVAAVYEKPIHLGEGGETVTMGADVRDIAVHLAQHPPGSIRHLPGHSAFVTIYDDWTLHAAQPPTWVQVDWSTPAEDPLLVDDFERQLAEFYDCARKAPENVEDTHWTEDGSPPGVNSGKFVTSEEG